MTTKLYEIADQYRFLEQSLEADDGIDEDNLATQLSELKVRFEDKAENVGKFILSLEAEGKAISAEQERLNARRVKITKQIDRLKAYLLQEMIVSKIERVGRTLFTISIRRSPPSVNVISADSIPKGFRRIIPETWQPDKKLILDHFKGTGEIVEGVEIVTDKKSLQIK